MGPQKVVRLFGERRIYGANKPWGLRQGAHSVLCSDDVASNGGSLAITSSTCHATKKTFSFSGPRIRVLPKVSWDIEKNLSACKWTYFLEFILCANWSARPRANATCIVNSHFLEHGQTLKEKIGAWPHTTSRDQWFFLFTKLFARVKEKATREFGQAK